MPRHSMWRCPWPVPRPHGAVQDRREVPRHQLPVHGRLRGQRLLLCGNSHAPGVSQGETWLAHSMRFTSDFVPL